MALRSSSSTYVLAIDLLVGGCFALVLACIVPSMSPALWGLFHVCYICSSISYMLTAACCGCIGSSNSLYLLCSSSIYSRYIPPRPNTLTLSCTLPCQSSESCHDRTTFIVLYLCLYTTPHTHTDTHTHTHTQ